MSVNHRIHILRFNTKRASSILQVFQERDLMSGQTSSETIGLIIVDHGSRRRESNEMLEVAAKRFAAQSHYTIVEPAHMELAEPTIAQAFDKCVARGASQVIIFPYFLSPGRHWTADIPSLAADAARNHPEIRWLVTAPFGLHPGMLEIIHDRIQHCLNHARSPEDSADCDVCENSNRCEFRSNREKSE